MNPSDFSDILIMFTQYAPSMEQIVGVVSQGAMLAILVFILLVMFAKTLLLLTAFLVFHFCVVAWAKAFVAGVKEQQQ